MLVKETTVDIRTLQRPTINQAHQADATRRDQAFQEEDLQVGNIQILRRTQKDATIQLSTVKPIGGKLWIPMDTTTNYIGRTD
jgi:hypothetical protein